MTVEACKRIIWRLAESGGLDKITYGRLRLAIMEECGTDERTIEKYVTTLKRLGWIKPGERFGSFTATEKGKVT